MLASSNAWPFQSQELLLRLYKMAKFIFRVLAGTSEVERICAGDPRMTPSTSSSLSALDPAASGGFLGGIKRTIGRRDDIAPYSPPMAEALWVSLSRTSKLQSFRDMMLLDDADPVAIADEILAAKKFSTDKDELRDNLISCVAAIVRYSAVLTRTRALQKTKFNSDAPEHELMLDSLWMSLLPSTPRKDGRITSEWGQIGFQGKDPATDFRGGGLLALQQLLFFAESRKTAAQAMLSDPRITEIAKYPFSCCGINITAEITRMLETRVLLGPAIYSADSIDSGIEALHQVYSDVFEFFHEEYASTSPADVMAFPPCFKATIAKIEAALQQTGKIPTPGANATSKKRD